MNRISTRIFAAFFLLLFTASVLAQSVVRGPYLQQQTDGSIIVRWRTDVATDSVVRYGPDPGSLSSSASVGGSRIEHIVPVAGLSALTQYYYSVGNSVGTIAGDATYHFHTAPVIGAPTTTRFWAIGDSGTAVTHPGQAAAVRDAFKAWSASSPADFMMMLGDNAYNDGTDAQYQDAVFDTYPELLRQLPVWSTLGNHDGHSADSATQTGPYYDIFEFPTASEVGGYPSGTEAYYSFDYGDVHLICLDSYDSPRGVNGSMMTWLESDLAENDKPWVIAFWHHPPYSKGSHNSDSAGETQMTDMRQNFLPVLEAWGVDLVLTGHSHSYERSFLLDGHYGVSSTLDLSDPSIHVLDWGDGSETGNGAYEKPGIVAAENQGAVYIVAGSSGKISGGSLNHPAMFVGLNSLGSMVVDIVGNRLDAVFIDETGLVRDEFTLLKSPDLDPPLITGARAEDFTHVIVDFSERVDVASAGLTANYDVSGHIVSAVEIIAGNRSVRLTINTMTPGESNVVTVNNVMDEEGNTIVPNSQFAFDFIPEVTQSFQDGLAPTPDYDGTSDSYIREASATTNYGAAATLQVDGDEPSSSTNDMNIVIAWDIIDIPATATVESARIHLNTLNVGGPYSCFELLKAWNQDEVSWNEAAAGDPWGAPGAEAVTDRDILSLCTFNAGSTGPITIDLNADGIALVQSWVDGMGANNGIIIADSVTTNGADFDSSESATAMNRPKLEITYTMPAIPPDLPPSAHFSASCTDLDCDFTDFSTDNEGPIASWDWDFGDGNSSVLQNPSHSYAAGGSYTVSLTVMDEDGLTDEVSHLVTVAPPNQAPTADFTYSCTELDCSFTDASTDSDGTIASWSWDFGDAANSPVQNPGHIYAATGTYTVSLTVSDDDGATDQVDRLVTVSDTQAAGAKSLVIMLDGIRSDGIINSVTPNIDSLIDGSFGGGAYQGAYAYYAQTIQDAPTSSAYNHVSIMTGVSGAKHGIASNDAAGIASVDYNVYPTYLASLESANSGLNTAFLATWTADLSMVTGADYDKDSTDAGNVSRVVDILNGTFSDPSGDNGTSWSGGTDVDAIALFIDDIDGAGHGNGFDPEVAAYKAEIESVDAQIGQILTAIENRPGFASENWQIVIVTDHGGFGTSHGGLNSNSETIPFIVASKSVSQGLLAGRVLNQDTAATAITHLVGATAVPGHYDGVSQGSNISAPPPAELTDDLVVYLPFNGDFLDASGQANDASIGADSDHDPIAHPGGGKFGGYVEINDLGGGASDASYLTLGKPADMEFGGATSFTITTWFRAQANQTGDPVILGNKDWVSGLNTGTLLLADEGDGDDFGFNVADGTLRRDIEPIDYTFDEWWFQAVSVDRSGNAVMFVGSPNGVLRVISDFADDLGDISSSLPWNIGQDGTGAYPHNLDGDVDEIAVWRRVLALGEIQQLFNGGSGIDLAGLFNQAPTASFTFNCNDLDCSFTDTSTDSDGSITGWSWDFGDANVSSAQNPNHSFAADGSYTVSLTATDNDGSSDGVNHEVTVSLTVGGGTLEVISWVPVYAIPQSQAAAQADFGDCDAADGLSRVGLQFWTPNSDGSIKYADHEFYTPVDADVTWWTNWGASNGIEIYLTIYNNTGEWDWDLARSAFASNRATFVAALIAEMDRHSLDGIDLDLEGIDGSIIPSDRADYDQFVHDLYLETSARGKGLTINSFPYIWNAPNQDWWGDWVGEVDNIHSMGYQELYEGGSSWHQYSYQQNTGIAAGHDAEAVSMGMPGWLATWGVTAGRGTTAQAHVQEVRYDLAQPTGIAIWDLQLTAWQDSDLWCEIATLRDSGLPGVPDAPGGLGASTFSGSRIDLAWQDNSDDEDGFKVERSPDGLGSWAEVSALAAGSTAYSDTGLAADTTWHYRVFAHNVTGNSGFSNVDSATTFTVPRTIQFSGRNWTVKSSTSPVGPGPNYFGNTSDDVWIDGNGFLHLKIVFRDGNWHSSEVIGDDVLGHGTYTFTLGSRVDLLDRNIVVGLFTWDTSAPEFNYREIDIEFSRWGDPLADNSQYVVQPWDTPGNTLRWETTLTGDESTHAFEWRPDRVEFSSHQGSPPGAVIQTWTYNGADVPPEGASSGNARINFWLMGGAAPFDGQEAELVVQSFDFMPLPANVPPMAGFTESCTDLDCDFTDTSSDTDGSIVSWAWDFGEGGSSTAQNPSHSYASDGSYTVELTVTDNEGATDVTSKLVNVSTLPLFTDVVASADIFGAGTVSGSYTATQTDNGTAQTIRERESGGKKQNRYSYLVHTWQADLPANAMATVHVNAWSGGSSDDQFVFSWSRDNVNYNELFTVSSTDTANEQSAPLPEVVVGPVYIRVEDSDQTAGNRSLDTVFVDHLYIRAESGAGDPPAAPSALIATAAGFDQINLVWTDNAADESGFEIERSLDNVNFSPLTTTGADVTGYPDSGLVASTTYWYRVRAWNASGQSAWSNTGSATTDAPPPPPLAPSGLTAVSSGPNSIDLSWLDNSDNEQGFEIERSLDNVVFESAGSTGANVTVFTDTGRSPDTTYWYRAYAFNAADNSPYSNTNFATTDAGPIITLTLNGYKIKGKHNIDLSWSGTTLLNVDIYRDGGLLETVADTGAYTDATSNKGGRTYDYQVCEEGTANCSDIVSVTF